jgi:tetratricopeptide (TPR) repeat protein
MAHYDDETLFQYVEGTSPIASEIELHMSSCDTCAEEIGGHREIADVLREAETWVETAPAPRRFVIDVVAFAERARREEVEAAKICDSVLTGPAAWWPQRLRQAEHARTGGMVKELIERARVIMDTSPANGLAATALAIDVANELDINEYPCDYVLKLRAQAYREHAFLLSFVGRFPEALEMSNRAERLFLQVPLPEYDLARLSLVRASILQSLDRRQEAIQLAHDAAETFARFGDRSRYLNARVTEAGMMFLSGQVREALALWTSIQNDPELESETRVRILHNVANCHVELQQPGKAIGALQSVIPEFELLGMETERTRSRWLLGQALHGAGKTREALPIFRQTWREFDDLDMVTDAALAALDLSEALLILGEVHEVPTICREIVARFNRAGMTSRAMTALSFLREAIALGEATPSLIRHVHSFLRKLPDERPRLHPPSPPAGAGE